MHINSSKVATGFMLFALGAGVSWVIWEGSRSYRAESFRWAARSGDINAVKAMVGGDPELVTSADVQYGATALHWAAAYGHKDIVVLLLAHKADVNARLNSNARLDVLAGNTAVSSGACTPLHLAVAEGHAGIVEVLLTSKADVNAKTEDGLTPLHLAAVGGFTDITTLLLDNGADVNCEAGNSVTPLRLALEKGHNEVAELLRQHGGRQ